MSPGVDEGGIGREAGEERRFEFLGFATPPELIVFAGPSARFVAGDFLEGPVDFVGEDCFRNLPCCVACRGRHGSLFVNNS